MSKKSIIAKLLSEEDISVVHKKTKTAAFNVESRELILPIWKDEMSKDISDLFICHEIGHAIQHKEKYAPLEQRTKLVKNTAWITSIGGGILYSGIPIILATGSFGLIKICLFIVLLSVLISALVHLITLDVEIDASFNRALPILEEKVPVEYHNGCRSVLRAAAFTYVIGALTNFLSLRYVWTLLSRLR